MTLFARLYLHPGATTFLHFFPPPSPRATALLSPSRGCGCTKGCSCVRWTREAERPPPLTPRGNPAEDTLAKSISPRCGHFVGSIRRLPGRSFSPVCFAPCGWIPVPEGSVSTFMEALPPVLPPHSGAGTTLSQGDHPTPAPSLRLSCHAASSVVPPEPPGQGVTPTPRTDVLNPPLPLKVHPCLVVAHFFWAPGAGLVSGHWLTNFCLFPCNFPDLGDGFLFDLIVFRGPGVGFYSVMGLKMALELSQGTRGGGGYAQRHPSPPSWQPSCGHRSLRPNSVSVRQGKEPPPVVFLLWVTKFHISFAVRLDNHRNIHPAVLCIRPR